MSLAFVISVRFVFIATVFISTMYSFAALPQTGDDFGGRDRHSIGIEPSSRVELKIQNLCPRFSSTVSRDDEAQTASASTSMQNSRGGRRQTATLTRLEQVGIFFSQHPKRQKGWVSGFSPTKRQKGWVSGFSQGFVKRVAVWVFAAT